MMIELMSQHPLMTFFGGVLFGAIVTFIGMLWILGNAENIQIWR